jgi:hypothetical protein
VIGWQSSEDSTTDQTMKGYTARLVDEEVELEAHTVSGNHAILIIPLLFRSIGMDTDRAVHRL